MSSSPNESISDMRCGENIDLEINMSPVTNLTLNLKSLNTSLTGTPTRRISWSNPFPINTNLSKLVDEFSPSTDSPTFQEVCSKSVLPKTSKILHLDNEEEKENIAPKRINIPSFRHKSSHEMLESDSQDSGYSSQFLQNFETSSFDSTPSRIKSPFFEDSNDSFENIMEMEVDDYASIPSPVSDVSSLLTKPLFNRMENESTPNNCDDRKNRLPIRRCLSMQMDCSPNSFKMEFSKTNTYISPYHEQNQEKLDVSKKCPFKRPDPPNAYLSVQSKRRKSSPSINVSQSVESESFVYKRSFSETAATIMYAVLKSDLQPDLIGDCSKSYALPLVNGRHQDLKCISPETLVQLIKGDFKHEIENYTLIDCRYPYEFEAGHIQGAKNIFTKYDIFETFLKEKPVHNVGRNIIIFHCEFSSERAPNLCRFLRNKDREINDYPKLYHPEIYILEGGYKAFFANFKEYCEPQDYKPMNHKDHTSELRQFRAKSKSWGSDSKSRYKIKSTVKEII